MSDKNSTPGQRAKRLGEIADSDQKAVAALGLGQSPMSPEERFALQLSALKPCAREHGVEGNDSTVYGHRGSIRICIRLWGSNTWVFDPRHEGL